MMERIFPPWLFKLCNFLGALPIRVSQDGSLQFDYISVIRSSVIFLVLYVSTAVFGTNRLFYYKGASLAGVYFGLMFRFVQIGAMAMVIVNTVKCWKGRMSVVMNILTTYDELFITMNFLHLKYKYSYFQAINLLFMFLYVGFLVPFQVYAGVKKSGTIQDFILNQGILFYDVAYLYFYIQFVIYTSLVTSIDKNFTNLNRYIKFSQHSINNILIETHELTIKNISKMCILFTNTVEETNSIFGIPLVIYFVNMSVFGVNGVLYSMAYFVQSHATKFQVLVIANLLGWLLFTFYQLIAICYVTHRCSYQARRTRHHLCQLLTCELPPGVRAALEAALAHGASSSAQFTALGLFNIDLPVVTKLLSLVVTYFIALVQFASTNNK